MGLATVLAEAFWRQAASGRDWAWEEPLLGQGRGCRTPACADTEDAGNANARPVQGCQVLPRVQGHPQSHLGVTAGPGGLQRMQRVGGNGMGRSAAMGGLNTDTRSDRMGWA